MKGAGAMAIFGIIMLIAAVGAVFLSIWGIQTGQANYYSFLTPAGLFMMGLVCIFSKG
ncbi:MAG: hypothetical protein QXP39_00655 [Candidatus Aenigmatarchaeota archaeon]